METDLDGAIEGYRQALHVYVKGDPKPVMEFFSRRDDVTLAIRLALLASDRRKSTRRQRREPRSSGTAPYAVSRRCLDIALPT